MIASLRRRHRFTFIALTAVLPALVAAAWLNKPEMPRSSLPGELLAQPSGAELMSADAGFAEHRAQLRRFDGSIELIFETSLRAPDVLAYLSAAGSASGLPADARLLGSVHPTRANVYELDASASGYLLLYSLGHQALLDQASLEALREPAPAADPGADEQSEDVAPEETATESGGAP